jgi:hypothetical protein
VLIVSLIGWKAAGYVGAVVAMVAMCAPSSLLTLPDRQRWERFRDAPWRIATQSALAPITVGLILASGYVLTRTIDHEWTAYAVTAVTRSSRCSRACIRCGCWRSAAIGCARIDLARIVATAGDSPFRRAHHDLFAFPALRDHSW